MDSISEKRTMRTLDMTQGNPVRLILTFAISMLIGNILRATGNNRTPLVFLILSSLLNLTLDMLFMILLHTSIASVLLATVIAQAVSAALCGVYIFRNYREYLPRTSDWKSSHGLSAEIFTTGFSMTMMQCVFALAPLPERGALLFAIDQSVGLQRFFVEVIGLEPDAFWLSIAIVDLLE